MTGRRGSVDVSVVRTTAREDVAWTGAVLEVPVERPLVRVAMYRSTAVVLGCAQRITEQDRLRATAAGIDLLVRQSGGGAVLTGPWLLGASVALPPSHPFATMTLPSSYRWLGRACVRWLGGMGIVGQSLPAHAEADGPQPWACFGRTASWEVKCAGRKIAGFAQVRRRSGVVFNAGVLLDAPPWRLMCAVLGKSYDEALQLSAGTVACERLLLQPLPVESAAAAWGEYLAVALGAGCAVRTA